jgi:NADH dehydrogenase
MGQHSEVLVIGGGYAGVMAANRLTGRAGVHVTLINPRPEFVERIRLHQLVGGSHDAVVDYRRVLAGRVRLVVDAVIRIDAAARSVTLAGGDTVRYDYLIYAVGSGDPAAPAGAHSIATYETAQRLRAALAAAPGDPVTVVGGGPTGIETAAELAGTGRAVTLVCGGQLNRYLHPKGRRAVAARLAALGGTVLDTAAVTSVGLDSVTLDDGRDVPTAVTVWTAGFAVPPLAAHSGLATDPDGRLLTDETLTSVDDDRIVAAGDSAAPSGRPFRMSCQAAGPLGAHAADTVLRKIDGQAPQPVAMGFFGQCISLGRHDGIFQFAHSDDTARGLYVAGWAGARLKQVVCWGTVKQLSWEARRPGLFALPGWATDRTRKSPVVAR